MPEKRKGPVERLVEWASTPRGDWALGVATQEKGLTLFDPLDNNLSLWSGPNFPLSTAGYYGGSIDYRVASGDLVDSSVVMVCLNWLMRVFPGARCRVVLEGEDGLVPVKDHALTWLLKNPNPDYSGTQLWRCTVLSYNWNGNAYWRKVRNEAGQVIELWYEPHFTIRPRRANSKEFVSHYEIWRDREWQYINKKDIVHFRWVLSPDQQMVGMGPIDSGLREIFTDNAAAQFTAAMFRNYGVFSRMISPKEGDAPLTQAEIIRLIAEFQAATTGDNRGRMIGSTMPVEIYEGQADVSKMDTRENRKTPEERISGLLGISPQVVGLGAGLDRNILGSPEEAQRWAYTNNILPCYNDFAETLDRQLVNDFTSIRDETVEFDTSKIEVLKGDIIKKETGATLMWNSNAITRKQFKIRIGERPAADGTDDGYKWELVPGSGGTSPQDAPLALTPAEDGKAHTNGHTDLRTHLAALLLPEGSKAKGKVDKERQKIEDELIEELAGELEATYEEAAGKI